jgi:hypothetical protein
MQSLTGSSRVGLVAGQKHVLLGAQGCDSWGDFRVPCLLFVFMATQKIFVLSEPNLPDWSPQMVCHEFKPSVTRLFLVVQLLHQMKARSEGDKLVVSACNIQHANRVCLG